MIKRLSVRYCLIFIVFSFCFLSCKKAPDEDWSFSGKVHTFISAYTLESNVLFIISVEHNLPPITQFDLKIYIHEKDKVSILYEGQITGVYFNNSFSLAEYNVEYGSVVRFDVVVNNKIRSYSIINE